MAGRLGSPHGLLAWKRQGMPGPNRGEGKHQPERPCRRILAQGSPKHTSTLSDTPVPFGEVTFSLQSTPPGEIRHSHSSERGRAAAASRRKGCCCLGRGGTEDNQLLTSSGMGQALTGAMLGQSAVLSGVTGVNVAAPPRRSPRGARGAAAAQVPRGPHSRDPGSAPWTK